MYVGKYKTKDGKEMYRITISAGINQQTGKKKYITRRGFETKKKATLAGARLELAISKGDLDKKPEHILFEDVYHEWYGNYINTVRESTYARTEGMFNNHILPEFGNKRIASITTRDVQQAVKKWFENTTANYKRWYNYVVAVMDYAVRQEYMVKNPAKAVILPKHEASIGDPPPKYWDKEQMNLFLSSIDRDASPDIYTMFRTLAFTGVRRGELLALEWQDVNFKENTIRVNKTLTQGENGRQIVQATKTRAGTRTIPVDKVTMNQLKTWRHLQQVKYFQLGMNTLNPQQLVFSNSKNGYHSLNTPSKRLRKILKDNKLKLPPITIHGFRHSFISNLLIAGVSVTAVQKIVGHASPEITLSVYAHVNEKQEREATDTLLEFMQN